MQQIQPRTFLIFSLLVAAAIAYTIFVFEYRVTNNALVQDYENTLVDCAQLTTEAQCSAYERCEAIYAPVCSGCTEVTFMGCQKISAPVALQLDEDKTVCEATGGMWYRNQYGQFCLCEKAGLNKVFAEGQGCVDR